MPELVSDRLVVAAVGVEKPYRETRSPDEA
jgi:hypothetical protein